MSCAKFYTMVGAAEKRKVPVVIFRKWVVAFWDIGNRVMMMRWLQDELFLYSDAKHVQKEFREYFVMFPRMPVKNNGLTDYFYVNPCHVAEIADAGLLTGNFQYHDCSKLFLSSGGAIYVPLTMADVMKKISSWGVKWKTEK